MWKIFVIICLLTLGQSAFANTILTCGENKGHAFYFVGQLVKPKDAGWHEDGISGGKTALSLSADNLDILFSDASGHLQSASATGGQVALLGTDGTWITVLVNYQNATTELYTFNLKTKIYAISSHKYGASPIQKASTFIGRCF